MGRMDRMPSIESRGPFWRFWPAARETGCGLQALRTAAVGPCFIRFIRGSARLSGDEFAVVR